jgi:uncharacterized protein
VPVRRLPTRRVDAEVGGALRRLPVALAAFGLLVSHGGWADAPSDLADAARRGDTSRVRSLLESDTAKDHVNAAGPSGMTAILWAAQHDDATLAGLLLEAGADPKIANRYGISPLWLAATNRSAPLVKLLLEHGADASAALPQGETALMAAARSGDVESIRTLLAAGADPNASESSNGETAVMWAAAEDHADAVRALVEGGADPNARARVLNLPAMNWEQTGMVSTVLPVGGWTALLYAARDDARAGALALAEVGADLDAQDPDGTSALSLAIMNAHYDLAAKLLEAGADPNVADRSGMAALYTAVDMITLGREIGRPERPHLDELGALDLVRLTLARGANVNAQLTGPTIPRHHGFPDRSLSAGATALMRAARSHDLESMRVLLEAGADAKLTQADGSNVLFSAVAPPLRGAGDAGVAAAKDAVLLALQAGADLHTKAANGETALHRAARQANATAVTVLVEQGLPLDVRDEAGRTPLDIVSQPGRTANDEIAALLRQLAGREVLESEVAR